MSSALLKRVYSLRNLEDAWRVICRNGKTSKSEKVRIEIEQFSEDANHNLRSLMVRLSKSTFRFQPAKGIRVPKLDEHGRKTGKFRPIVLAPVESRIVQRALLNVLVEIPALQTFTHTPYSFGGLRSKSKSGHGAGISSDDKLAAVPAAIRAVLDEIKNGAKFVACADIKSFFTQISKTHVIEKISSAVHDPELISFLKEAMHVELSNMAELREGARAFPIEDVGVAQGNSLSSLLGNIALAEFDRVMNENDCRCIRYIDDIIILAPTEKAANARLSLAVKQLAKLNMEFSSEKSSTRAQSVNAGFMFLGIEIMPGIIRPSKKARDKFIASVTAEFSKSQKIYENVDKSEAVQKTQSLIATLKRVDGMIDGWGKHYWFCNDHTTFANLDQKLGDMIGTFLGSYASARDKLGTKYRRSLLGIVELTSMARNPFTYPSAN